MSESERKSKKLHKLFVNEQSNKIVELRKSTSLTMKDHTVYKKLSLDIVMFRTHLYYEGYFKDSNFLRRKKFDITCLEGSYAYDLTKDQHQLYRPILMLVVISLLPVTFVQFVDLPKSMMLRGLSNRSFFWIPQVYKKFCANFSTSQICDVIDL